MSACIAVRLLIVSSSDSPLAALERTMSRLNTSADKRRAAISNVVRVRVLFSKNRLNTLLPRSSGTLFTSRSAMLMKLSAVLKMRSTTSRGKPFDGEQMMQLAFPVQLRIAAFYSAPRVLHGQMQTIVVVACQHHADRGRQLDRRADDAGGNRQFAAATVDQHCQVDLRGPSVVEDFVHRRAHRAAGIQNIVDQQNVAAGHVERDLRRPHRRLQSGLIEVIAIKRDVENPDRRFDVELSLQPLGEPDTAGVHAHQVQWLVSVVLTRAACELPINRLGVELKHRSNRHLAIAEE